MNIETLLKYYTGEISKNLVSLGVGDIEIADPVWKKSGDMDDFLIFGQPGVSDTNLAELISSEGIILEGMPVKMALIPEMPNGYLYTSGSELGAKVAFTVEDQMIVPILTSIPFRVDAYNYDCIRNSKAYSGFAQITPKEVQKFIFSKLSNKKVVNRTSKYKELVNNRNLRSNLERFVEKMNDFVIKADTGCGGEEVRLFSQEDMEVAVEYTRMLFQKKYRVLVEERVESHNWRMEFNIRTLVTAGEDPSWVAGVARFGDRDYNPKNMNAGAKGRDVETLVEDIGFDLDKLKEEAILDVKNLHSRFGVFYGLIAGDYIPNGNGNFCLELNCANVGGMGAMVETHNRPIENFSKIFMESLKPFLLKRLKRRQAKPKWKKFPLNHQDYNNLGNIFWNLRRIPESIKFYKSSMNLDSKYGFPIRNLGGLLSSLGRVHEAEKLINLALKIDPYDPYAVSHLAEILYHQGKSNEIKSLLETTIKLHPLNKGITIAYANFLNRENDKRAVQYYREGGLRQIDINIARGNIDDAFNHISSSDNFKDFQYSLDLARCLQATGQLTEAKTILEKVESSGENDYHRYVLVEVYKELEEYEVALSLLDDLKNASPKNLKPRMKLSRLYEKLGHLKWSRDELLYAFKIAPHEPSVQISLANNASLREDYKNAYFWFSKLVKTNPNNSDYWLNFGRTAKLLEKDKEAESFFLNSLKLNPNKVEALDELIKLSEPGLLSLHLCEKYSMPKDAYWHIRKGLAFYEMMEIKEGFKSFKKALRAEPGHPLAMDLIGQYYSNRKLDRLAEKMFTELTNQHPTYSYGHLNFGRFLIERNRDIGVSHLYRALEIDENFYQARLELGMYFLNRDVYNLALPQLKKALEIKSAGEAKHWYAVALNRAGRIEESMKFFKESFNEIPKEERESIKNKIKFI